MPADEKKTLKDAKDALDAIAGHAMNVESQTGLVEKQFKEQKLPLQTIQTSINVLKKDADLYRGQLKEARKALDALEKFRSADAVALAKKLESGIKSSAQAVKDFDGSLAVFDKVWTRCWEAEKNLRQLLDKGIESAQASLKPLSNAVVDLPRHAEGLRQACARKHIAGIRQSIETLTGEVRTCGAEITTAQSIVASLETVLKGRGAAYHPEVVQLADAADKLQAQLGKYATLAKGLIGKALVEIKDARAVAAQLELVAATGGVKPGAKSAAPV